MNWLKRNKGYLIHGAAMLVGFLNPSVKEFIAAHPHTSLFAGTLWGWLLHWSNGRTS